jgi:small subunit ribosomal protein S1
MVEGPVQKEREEISTLYETSMRSLEEGNILKGKVIDVRDTTVIVDVGMKSEGMLSISEFATRDGQLNVKVGDEVEVMIVGTDKESSLLMLSKKRVDYVRAWERVKKSLGQGVPLDGEVVSEVKGGFIVDIGINAFLPLSQVDIKPLKNPSSFIGRHLKFKVVKADEKKGSVILSRRVLLEEERDKRRKEFFKNVKEGQVLYGIVKNMTDYGAFVDLGGVDGFLYVSDITWGRIQHPRQFLKIGDEVKVKVLSIDAEKMKVSVGMKQLKPDPWLSVAEKYPVGTKVRGKIVNIVNYGAFVEIEPGVEGLLHVNDMTWEKRARRPEDVLKKGEVLDLLVIDVDAEKRRIALGLKQLLPDPWDELEKKYPPGSVVKGRVKNATSFGLFIGVGRGIDGLVHASEISWSRRKRDIQATYKKGSWVEAMVLNIDKEQKRFSLSIKRLKEDPWKGVSERHRVGEIVEGFVTSITDFGVFVEIEEGVEGLLHRSEIDGGKGKDLSQLFKIDDLVQSVILSIDEQKKKIGLSQRALRRMEERALLGSIGGEAKSFTLGEVLRPLIDEGRG